MEELSECLNDPSSSVGAGTLALKTPAGIRANHERGTVLWDMRERRYDDMALVGGEHLTGRNLREPSVHWVDLSPGAAAEMPVIGTPAVTNAIPGMCGVVMKPKRRLKCEITAPFGYLDVRWRI